MIVRELLDEEEEEEEDEGERELRDDLRNLGDEAGTGEKKK